jgi:Zn-dependent peptidase ImmA (M78 family)
MRYGFKASAERISRQERVELGLASCDKIDAWDFLKSKGIHVFDLNKLKDVSENAIKQLTEFDADFWSGMTIHEAGLTAVIVNPTHAAVRLSNTLMHEWAHIYLKHEPKRVDFTEDGLLLLSDYATEYEDEANWLAGALLLPRDALILHKKMGKTAIQIAQHYGVSEELVNWRIRMTGIERQLSYR